MTLSNTIYDILDNNYQVILTGAPGTGKTFTVQKYIKDRTGEDNPGNRWTFVQFHPSYDYSDFVEGLKPVPNTTGHGNMFVRIDGCFKAFCRKIVLDELEQIKKGRAMATDGDAFNYYKELHKEKNPENDTDDSIPQEPTLNAVHDYYFVVDEINRADLSKVFGEIMYCLDEDYRGPNNAIQTQYAALKTYHKDPVTGKYQELSFDCFEDGFFIPKNLHIIGTMNDIDRSVESFDFALRRRFLWKEIEANESMKEIDDLVKKHIVSTQINVAELINRATRINNLLDSSNSKYKRLGLNKQYQLGKAYFKKFDGSESSLQEIYNGKIEPIIKEYTRGRDQQLVEALLDEIKKILFGTSTETGSTDNNEDMTSSESDRDNE